VRQIGAKNCIQIRFNFSFRVISIDFDLRFILQIFMYSFGAIMLQSVTLPQNFSNDVPFQNSTMSKDLREQSDDPNSDRFCYFDPLV